MRDLPVGDRESLPLTGPLHSKEPRMKEKMLAATAVLANVGASVRWC